MKLILVRIFRTRNMVSLTRDTKNFEFDFVDKPDLKIGGQILEKITVLLKKDWSVSDFDNWVWYFFSHFLVSQLHKKSNPIV